MATKLLDLRDVPGFTLDTGRDAHGRTALEIARGAGTAGGWPKDVVEQFEAAMAGGVPGPPCGGGEKAK